MNWVTRNGLNGAVTQFLTQLFRQAGAAGGSSRVRPHARLLLADASQLAVKLDSARGRAVESTVVVLNRACTCADRPPRSANYAFDPAQMLGSRTPVLNCAVRR